MVQLVDIRRLVDRLTKKEQRGNVISGDDFNTFLRISQAEHFDAQKRKAEQTGDIVDSLRAFITIVNVVTSSGVSSIPSNYGKLISMTRMYGSDYVKCDVVTQMEKEDRLSNSLTEGTSKHPICSIDGTSFRFIPASDAYIKYIYYKKPDDPLLDWYIDNNDEYQYLAASAVHVWVTGETDSSGTVHTTGDVNYTSTTVELEWLDDYDRVAIAYRLLTKVGVTIPSNLAIELGMSTTMQSNANV